MSSYSLSNLPMITRILFIMLILGLGFFAPRPAHAVSTSPANCVPTADFDVSSDPTHLTLQAGATGLSTVTVTPVNGFNIAISLAAVTVPPDLTVTLSATSLDVSAGPATFIATVKASSTIASGDYSFVVNATTTTTLFHEHSIFVTVPAPELGITASKDHVTIQLGSSDTLVITLESLYSLPSTTVTLTDKISSGLPNPTFPIVTFNPTSLPLNLGGTATSTLTIATSQTTLATTPGEYRVEVNGIANPGSVSNTTTIEVFVMTPTFFMFATPYLLTIPAGSNAHSTINVTSVDGFTGTVDLTATPLPPNPGITTSLNPASIAITAGFPPVTSDLRVDVGPLAMPGFYSVFVTGMSGSTRGSAYVAIVVPGPGYSITGNPDPLTVSNSGTAATSMMTLASLNGFADTVGLSIFCSPEGLTADMTPASVMVPMGGSGTAALTVSASSFTVPGNYTIGVLGTGTRTFLSNYTSITVIVAGPDFKLTSTPEIVYLTTGATAQASITATSKMGFSGSIKLVTSVFSLSGTSTGLIASLDKTTLNPTSSTPATATLTLTATVADYYAVEVTGISWPIVHTAQVIAGVTQPIPDYSLTPTSTTITVAANSMGTDSLRVDALNGFTGTITFARVGSPIGGVSYDCTPVSLDVITTSAVSTCSFSSSTPGTYSAIVTGTGGNPTVTHQATYTVAVTKAGPSISTTLSASTITAGGSVTDSATLTGTDLLTASGTVTYQYFTGSGCAGTAIMVGSPVAVSYGLIPTSQSQTFNSAGAFSWNALYSGDAANTGATSSCEPLTVNAPLDYTLTASPTTASITAGSTFTATITAKLTGGVASPVTLTISNSPNPSVCIPVSGASPCGSFSLSPLTITPTSAGATSTLTVATTATVPPGTYTLTIAGLPSGTSSASATITLTVTAAPTPDLSISANPTAVSATTDSPATSTITVSAVHGFTGTVTLSISAPSGITCTLDHTTLQGYGTATLTCNSSTPNDYTVTVTATGGAGQHTTTQTFHVAAAPSPAAPAPTILGLTPALFYGIIGVLIAAVIGGIVVVIRRKNP